VTIHKEGNFLQTPKRIKNFLKNFGVEPEITDQYLNSFTIKQKLNRDAKHARQLKISSTPMIVVDGKYIVEVKQGRSYQEMLNIVDHVIELQKPNS
jgi:thiol:disulfide interchange protein DsbA